MGTSTANYTRAGIRPQGGVETMTGTRSTRASMLTHFVAVYRHSRLLLFCITTLCDWFTKLAPLSQPMAIQTKTNRLLAARVFPRLAPVTCICFEF